MSRHAHVVCLVIPVRLTYRYWCKVYQQFDVSHHLAIYTLQFVMYGINAVDNCDIVCTYFCYYHLNWLLRELHLDTSVYVRICRYYSRLFPARVMFSRFNHNNSYTDECNICILQFNTDKQLNSIFLLEPLISFIGIFESTCQNWCWLLYCSCSYNYVSILLMVFILELFCSVLWFFSPKEF